MTFAITRRRAPLGFAIDRRSNTSPTITDVSGARLQQIVAVVGPQGRDATAIVNRIAGQALSGHCAVTVRSDDLVWLADPATDGDGVLGVTIGAAMVGQAATIVIHGEIIEPSWSWSPGAVWLAASGALTQNVPTMGSIVRVGTVAGPTRLFVEPRLIAKL